MDGMGVELDCLEGVRVVDFTQFEAGPSCTEALAWLGAEVVKIENPKTGDPARRLVPGKAPDDPWYFHMFNANKKSLAIDLKSPRGVHLVKELLKKADVTVENMAPGTIERLGLGYDEVKKLNPRRHVLDREDRKSTRLNSSHSSISYAVFCYRAHRDLHPFPTRRSSDLFNANKKSLAIDLKSPRGVHLVKELLKKADVTVENMAPGTIERLGLGYDEVKKLNPRRHVLDR